MSPTSQDSLISVQQTETEDGSQPLRLKICECFLDSQEIDGLGGDVEVILEEEDKSAALACSGSVNVESDDGEEEKEHHDEEDEEVDVDEESERLSLVNETGSCSGEEEEGFGGDGGLIDEDDSIYQVRFPTSFVELDESRHSCLAKIESSCSGGQTLIFWR